MIITEDTLRQFNDVIKEFTSDRIVIAAAPGQIRNNGEMVNAIQVVIGHNPTRKMYKHLYRGLTGNFRSWLKERIDKIDNA